MSVKSAQIGYSEFVRPEIVILGNRPHKFSLVLFQEAIFFPFCYLQSRRGPPIDTLAID